MTDRILYTVDEAAEATSVSSKTITRAIHKWMSATPDSSFPPPLPAKKKGRAYAILGSELRAWAERWPDA